VTTHVLHTHSPTCQLIHSRTLTLTHLFVNSSPPQVLADAMRWLTLYSLLPSGSGSGGVNSDVGEGYARSSEALADAVRAGTGSGGSGVGSSSFSGEIGSGMSDGVSGVGSAVGSASDSSLVSGGSGVDSVVSSVSGMSSAVGSGDSANGLFGVGRMGMTGVSALSLEEVRHPSLPLSLTSLLL
jgi:hypothetical protein